MFKPISLLTVTLLSISTLAGCGLDELDDSSPASFRSVVVSDSWDIHEDVAFPEVNSCYDYWNDRCAELTSSQCTVAKNRYSCTESDEGLVISDTYGALVNAVHWAAYSVGDEAPVTTKGSPSILCEQLHGVEYASCLGVALTAELAAQQAPELIEAFPNGGFATVAVQGELLVIEPLAEADHDIVYTTAAALDWRAPIIEGEFTLGEAPEVTLEPNTVITIRPNGTIGVSSERMTLLQQPRPLPPPKSAFVFGYSMSAPGANYNQQSSLVVGGWSRYAALWKSFIDANVGSVDVIASYAGGNFIPLLGAEQTLDYHEANYFTDIWGAPYDPVGTWMSADIDDPLTGLAFAAIVMHYWHSPVFFSGDWTPPLSVAPNGSWYKDIALESIRFRSPSFSSLHAACGISSTASAATALSQIQTCAFGGLTVEDAVVTAWSGDFSPSNAPALLHHQSISANQLLGAYAAGFTHGQGNPSGRVGELIFDPPPEADAEEIAAVFALAEFMASEIQAQAPLEEK
ncbi:hypothetical protein DB30_03920 [Enhygromyxa salina]|uniref:Uncharacterized protein n=1 Tax=Enhygromyxa salina TaxID=215803 RepID=A0A0C2D128_9BACT|nr:hypothetical protein [Enhygromyxa salina]KIG16936.1 hypothetical protein DB30_03920 [Enhygromyxa salina]